MKRSDFMKAIFPADLLERSESPLVSYPASFVNDEGTTVNYYKQQYWSPRMRGLDNRDEGWLYCVSTVARGDKPRRRLADVRAAFVLPCDDVGTKAIKPPVTPSYILETSPGNHQWGYMIDPFDVSTPEGASYYDACLLGLAQAGYNDFGCRSASRVIKMPGAVHHSGFITCVAEWYPDHVWDLKELMDELEVTPSAGARSGFRSSPGRHVALEDVSDPIYDWLVREDLVHGISSDWVEVACPWADLHSEPDNNMAGYSPLDYGSEGRGFNCFHSHGDDHGLVQFLAWVERQDGPSLDNTFTRLKNIRKALSNV